jgi:Mannosyltransferase (PIG-V)
MSTPAAVVTVPADPGPAPVTWRRALGYGIAAYLVSRLCVLAGAGVVASQRVVDANDAGLPQPGTGLDLITEVLVSWDGKWYLEIVRNGYPSAIPPDITYFQPEARAAFFPVFPTLVRWLDVVLPAGDVLAALMLNFVLGLVAVVLVGRIARRVTGDDEIAARAMVLFAVFPGSFVLSFAYSEATLVVAAAAAMLALLDRHWWVAGILGAVATATRPNGVAVAIACAVAALIAIRRDREWKALVAPILASMGFVAYQLFLWHHTGERFAWFRVQREAWQEGTSFGATAVSNTFSFLSAPLSSPTDALTMASLVALIAALWCLWKRPLPAPVVAYVIVVIVLMLLPATVTARPRFLFTAFPLVIPVAAWWPRRDKLGWELLLVGCGAGLATLTALYGVFGAIP